MPSNKIEGVTGRDPYLVAKGMLYAIAAIQSLPEERQEWSDMSDMCTLVRAMADHHPGFWSMIWGVERHIGRDIDLWPESESMSDEDVDYRDSMRAWINDQQRKFEASGAAADAPPSDVVDFLN